MSILTEAKHQVSRDLNLLLETVDAAERLGDLPADNMHLHPGSINLDIPANLAALRALRRALGRNISPCYYTRKYGPSWSKDVDRWFLWYQTRETLTPNNITVVIRLRPEGV